MKTKRIVKTAKKFEFKRRGEGWVLADSTNNKWKDALPTAQFLTYIPSNDVMYSLTVDGSRRIVGFQLDEDQDLTIGYDHETFTVFLDIDKKAFLENKENFFRVQQTNEENR